MSSSKTQQQGLLSYRAIYNHHLLLFLQANDSLKFFDAESVLSNNDAATMRIVSPLFYIFVVLTFPRL